MSRYNPFQPNRPVFKGMFVGRAMEIERFDEILDQTKLGNPSNVLIIGERGIGKSSLLLVGDHIAKGDVKWKGEGHNFLAVQISVNDDTTLLDLAHKISDGISREIDKECKEIAYLKKCWEFVQSVQISGSGIKRENVVISESELIDKIIYSIVDTIKAITEPSLMTKLGLREKKDGIVLLIDEADNASKHLKLGAFLKTLSEVLVREDCNELIMVLAGLPRLRDVLLESHESSLRLFEDHELSVLSPDEVKEVIKRGLSEVKEKSGITVSVDESALDEIVFFSEGYPHFVQQIGYSVLACDTDNVIKSEDVNKAMFMAGGALERIGERYYKKAYYDRIKEDAYRHILDIMAEKLDGWMSKREIGKKFKGKGSTLNNGIKALRDRNIILSKEGTKGLYRLQWKGFALWIKMKSDKYRKVDESKQEVPYGSHLGQVRYEDFKISKPSTHEGNGEGK